MKNEELRTRQRQSFFDRREHSIGNIFSILNSQFFILLALALGLRLLVWRWHARYPLGGDEQEYFDQALALLRTRQFVDLRLMRPPLYTVFLAACSYLFDSQVQRLRLIQAIVGALTVVPMYLLTSQLFGRRVALLAALLAALDFTLAASATELLTETLFVFGLATLLWLLLRAASLQSAWWAALAGLALGALTLLRSVALPLLPLGALWLLAQEPRTRNQEPLDTSVRRFSVLGYRLFPALAYLVAAILVIAPWTIRNYRAYGALILVDTTGVENLWLDNNPAGATPVDPLGREAAKRQLYALGDDRAARQRLATANGAAAIAGNPGWFARKAAGEGLKFFALQFFDDMRARRAIWVPPAEVWLRLLLGDGMWLALLLAGAAGLWLYREPRTENQEPRAESRQMRGSWLLVLGSRLADPRWLIVPWALYTLATALIFHVELRYRLPLYPVLIPYAAYMIVDCRAQIADWRRIRLAGAAITVAGLIAIALLHRPYVAEGWALAQKHAQLWRAERALAGGDAGSAAAAAGAALQHDPDSALARVALARAALLRGDRAGALEALGRAIDALKAQPYAHLLRGAILREAGDRAGAAAEFTYERSSQDDLQQWCWDTFANFATPPARLEPGAADLGFVRGFWLPEPGGARWTRDESQALLAAPPGAAHLAIDLQPGRPRGAAPRVTILVNGRQVGQFDPTGDWHVYRFDLPPDAIPVDRKIAVTLRSETFRPRDYDRASPDDRALGVLVRAIEVTP
jgi:4-amino-4-deoxy-L-arabinose transferase-like glycosyltransferase